MKLEAAGLGFAAAVAVAATVGAQTSSTTRTASPEAAAPPSSASPPDVTVAPDAAPSSEASAAPPPPPSASASPSAPPAPAPPSPDPTSPDPALLPPTAPSPSTVPLAPPVPSSSATPRPTAPPFTDAGKRMGPRATDRPARACRGDGQIRSITACDASERPGEPACLPPIINRWHPGNPIPPGYELRERSRPEFLLSGGLLLGTSWALTAIGAALSYESDPRPSRIPFFIPVVGPYIEGIYHQRGEAVAHYGSALFQTAGLGLLVWGLVDRSAYLVRTYRDEPGVSWWLSPFASTTTAGLGVKGVL
ncbi:MAG: hypothetical protein AAF715_32560 [Myxococcota bacterium]